MINNQKLEFFMKNLTYSCTLLTFLLSGISFAESSYVRLTSLWQGSEKCLDVINDGTNNKVQLATCGNYSGQFWKMDPVNDLGDFQLTNMWLGENKCLSATGPYNDVLEIIDCQGPLENTWNFLSYRHGEYQPLMPNGSDYVLDVLNDGQNNKLHLTYFGNYSGQYWKATPAQ